MYSLELKKKTMSINLYGNTYELRFPTIAEIESFDALTRTIEPSEVIGAMKSYLAALGLPTDVIQGIDSIDFSELVAYVNNPTSKKK